MTHGRGLLPSHPSRSAHRLGASEHPGIAAALKSGISGAADLTRFLPERFDQGQTETCHAHSLAAGLAVALAVQVKPLVFVPSPRLIASCTYADVRAVSVSPSSALPPLTDDGAELQDDADAVARWGIGPMSAPVEGRHSDCPSTQEPGFPEVDPQALVVSTRSLIGGEYQIDPADVEMVAASLDAGVPVWVGGTVGAAYQELAPTDVAQPTPASDKTAGGHAQLIAAYRTTGAELQFLVVNSWGTGWALNGTVWAGTAWMQALWSVWPLSVRVQS